MVCKYGSGVGLSASQKSSCCLAYIPKQWDNDSKGRFTVHRHHASTTLPRLVQPWARTSFSSLHASQAVEVVVNLPIHRALTRRQPKG